MMSLKTICAWPIEFFAFICKKETLGPAVVALIVSGIAGPLSTHWFNHQEAALHEREDATHKAISRFELESEAFGPFATVFVLGVSRDNKVDPQAFERLASNIIS